MRTTEGNTGTISQQLHILPLLVVSACAKRFHGRYIGQPAQLNRCSVGTTTVWYAYGYEQTPVREATQQSRASRLRRACSDGRSIRQLWSIGPQKKLTARTSASLFGGP